jgi:site-specific DNA-methyltransferase (adenine-specific)
MRIEPIFDKGGITLYCADAKDVIPQLEIYDLLLTDPPYCNDYQTNSREVLGEFNKIAGDDDRSAVINILYKSWRGLKINRHGYIFGPISPEMAAPGEVGGQTQLIWDKSSMSAGDLAAPWGVSHEPIWFGVKRYVGKGSERTGNLAARLRRGTVLRVSRTGETSRSHPTQKPVDLLSQLIEMSSSQNELVFDPFMGTGATCVAAIIENRRAIGIEIDPKYCEEAVVRVKQALKLMSEIRKLK